MHTTVVSKTTILVVLLALLVLTAATVGISFLHLEGCQHVALGLLIAVTKGTLVVTFFMHVIEAPTVVRTVILVAVFWLVGVMMALTFSDYSTRQRVQQMSPAPWERRPGGTSHSSNSFVTVAMNAPR